jgi:uncharacterized protein YheU (UPF0270 family)
MIIPYQELDTETLKNILESLALREGTDYGEQEMNLQNKVALLHQQLQSGQTVLVWSELHESINMLPTADFREETSN